MTPRHFRPTCFFWREKSEGMWTVAKSWRCCSTVRILDLLFFWKSKQLVLILTCLIVGSGWVFAPLPWNLRKYVDCWPCFYLAWSHLNIVGFCKKFLCGARRKLLIDNEVPCQLSESVKPFEDASGCCTLFAILQASIIYNKFQHWY